MFIRSAYNYDREAASLAAGFACADDSRTQQQFKDECDINVLVRRFGLTGVMPTNPRIPMQGDFTGVSDYQSAVNAVREAMDGFMELTADVREYFKNDPQNLLRFMQDAGNRDKAMELGLIPKPVEAPRVEKV